MKDAYKNTAALFESALEAVIGTDGEQVVFMNPAAVSALGEHRGEALSSLLPAEALPGGGWHYDEAHLTLLEDNGSGRYTFGMALEVECAAADPVSGQVDFILPGGTPVPRKRREAPGEGPGRGGKKGPRRPAKGRAMHVPRRRKGGRKR